MLSAICEVWYDFLEVLGWLCGLINVITILLSDREVCFVPGWGQRQCCFFGHEATLTLFGFSVSQGIWASAKLMLGSTQWRIRMFYDRGLFICLLLIT